ncbi:MAG: hypothetical protein GY868_06485 [Deltaproteobacteria bacterium]|nr:hypothetical protein [Deltaproteobacteria bacterium]
MLMEVLWFIRLLKSGLFPHSNGIVDAPGQSQLALSNIFITDKGAQPSAFSTQPTRNKDIVCIKKNVMVFLENIKS